MTIIEEHELNLKYSKDSCGFIANKQSEGISGWEITKNLIRYQDGGGILAKLAYHDSC